MLPEHHRVVIIGTGFAGLGAAIRLLEDGVSDLVLLERAHDVGGTWRDNGYPGCACDVPSHLYSFSFAQNPTWTRTYSRQPEIWSYLRRTAAEHGVVEKVRFGREVLRSTWLADAELWEIETTQGTYTADILISGAGALSDPMIPTLPGIETFAGPAFHSAQWDHDVELEGKRVAVIGTGASAIQFVPRLQQEVAGLTLFQRTPPWILPRSDRPLKPFEHLAYRHVPGAQSAMRTAVYWAREAFALPFLHPRLAPRLEKAAHAHIARAIADPVLRAKVTPDYQIGCKRILISNDYLPALAQPNVDVVTAGIREVVANGVIDADGVLHEADVIVYGTGFRVTDQPIAETITGRTGETLAASWGRSPAAHLGTTVPGFPNLFLLLGPNTGLGHTSVVYMIEAQIELVRSALRHLAARGLHTVEPTPAAQARWVADVDAMSAGTVWTSGGCASWYLDATGRNSTLWPSFTAPFRRRTHTFAPGDYVLHPRRTRTLEPA